MKAAGIWLGLAERSLEQENEIRGSLNLMLAQAELERAREARSAVWSPRRYRSLLIRSILIAGVAGLAVVVGFSGAWPERAEPAAAVTAAEPANRPDDRGAAAQTAAEAAVQAAAEPPPVAAPKARVGEAAAQSAAAAPPREKLSVSSIEMQRLLRAAGKSLRGE